MTMILQRQIAFDWAAPLPISASAQARRTGTFTDNMKLPVHRWFRYSAGYSAEWVRSMLRDDGGMFFDPFAGSGTGLIAAQESGLDSAGVEAQPFVARIARAKIGWDVDAAALVERAAALLARARQLAAPDDEAPALLRRCFDSEALERLDRLRVAYAQETEADAISNLLWLAITAIVRECSGVGTAQWQYVLPNKSKAKVAEPYLAFQRRIGIFASDIVARGAAMLSGDIGMTISPTDARDLRSFDHLRGKITKVVTSPPYPNNYDYADATRLEMTFWREIDGWGGLQSAARRMLIRSCTQHASAERLDLEALLDDPVVAPIRNELAATCRELADLRETKGGRKAYHTMVAAYFSDLAKVWLALKPLCADTATVCFVIGDSAPYGVHVPAERWLAQLALAAGFSSPRYDKVRDRNVKWKNRKHRVPLQEGNLWVRS